MNTNNHVEISGEVSENPVFNHKVMGESFYRMVINSERLSGTIDEIPVMISERLIDVTQDYKGMTIQVFGQFRSYNLYEENKNHLVLHVFARDINFNEDKMNHIFLDGYICKPPVYRKTPLGREIADLLIAVNRPYGKSDYIPCICWGRNARYSSNLKIGNKIRITGRIQSREYIKRMEDEKRIAFEVSISQMEVIESEECKDQVADAE